MLFIKLDGQSPLSLLPLTLDQDEDVLLLQWKGRHKTKLPAPKSKSKCKAMPKYEVFLIFGNSRNIPPTELRLKDMVARGQFADVVDKTGPVIGKSCQLRLTTQDVLESDVRSLVFGLRTNPQVGDVSYRLLGQPTVVIKTEG